MKVYTEIVYQMNEGNLTLVSEKSFEYEGPVARCDRWAQSQDKTQAGEAGTVAGDYGNTAAAEGGQVDALAMRDINAQHSLDPTQMNELLTSAGAGIGGAMGAAQGEANREAARTHNASGFTKSLDEMARDKMKAGAGVGESAAAQDVAGTQALHQAGAGLLASKYGTDVGAQLKAMGQQNTDIQSEVAAGQAGWLQNAEGALKTGTAIGGAIAGMQNT